VAENKTPTTSPYPPVIKLQLEVTLEQAHIIFLALKHYRTTMAFNADALQATVAEKQDAQRAMFLIDRLKGMFE
jgi:predicted nucleic-acid-binding protein